MLDNAIQFTISRDDHMDDAWAVIDGLEIPRDAIMLSVGVPEFLDGGSLRDRRRPVVGGVEYTGPQTCTIGFTTVRDNVEGMVVASHCTNHDGTVGDGNGEGGQLEAGRGYSLSLEGPLRQTLKFRASP